MSQPTGTDAVPMVGATACITSTGADAAYNSGARYLQRELE